MKKFSRKIFFVVWRQRCLEVWADAGRGEAFPSNTETEAAPAIPEDIQDAAKHGLAAMQVLLTGDQQNGKRRAAANVVPNTTDNVPGTVVTLRNCAQDDDGKWTELLGS